MPNSAIVPCLLPLFRVSIPFIPCVCSLYFRQTFSGLGRMSPRYDSSLGGETPVATGFYRFRPF
jgi:hypothetical protein